MSDDITLALEGATYAGSVAVIQGGEVIAERALENVPKPGRGGREERFLPMVAECLADAGVRTSDLARVVCGAGPGSFTSLRVAASVAKGIAVGADCPLFAVSSLLLIVAGSRVLDGSWLAAIPAMRGESYAALFEVAGDQIREIGGTRLVHDEALSGEAHRLGATIIGPGLHDAVLPHARGVAHVLPALLAQGACDIATWEPSYGRLAEAQVKWEAAHGRPLTAAG
ncbi:MAG: tRNA (adenosine(37)-N6)-threonylcarbamoyltransferase complex dimerization subunit type 1 TsaB [Gemmatimonadaceae bacterium]|nr:tRNA (adenosine(37)-N6)-threonylcarbamoyltransferase complex dimerization subunit type 1 TsaB [Gemmatimonadaceae bacterium]